MKIKCKKCHASYRLDEKKIPTDRPRILVRCKHCDYVMKINVSAGASRSDLNPQSTLPENPLFGESLKEEIIKNLKKLYPMPHVMWKARQLLADTNSDFKQLDALIKTDQALASRILKVANSAYFGMSGKISSIQHAAVVLGSNLLVRIITVLSQSKMLGRELPGYKMRSSDLWRHSLKVSVGSDIIAKKIVPEYSGEAFLTGLLHDAGKILLDPYILERKKIFDELTQKTHKPQVDIENKTLGCNHAIISGELCKHWNLPNFVGEAILFHHDPATSKANLLAYVVHAADTIAHESGNTIIEIAQAAAQNKSLKFLRMDVKELEKLARKIFDDVEALEEDAY
jgi:predicted Zn finger-like uncharacterized protein